MVEADKLLLSILDIYNLWSQNDVNMPWSGIYAPPANVLGLSIEEKDLLFCTHIGL